MRLSDLPNELQPANSLSRVDGKIVDGCCDTLATFIKNKELGLTVVTGPFPMWVHSAVHWSPPTVEGLKRFLSSARTSGAKMLLVDIGTAEPAVEASDGLISLIQKTDNCDVDVDALAASIAYASDQKDRVGYLTLRCVIDGTPFLFSVEADWFRSVTELVSDAHDQVGAETIWTAETGWVTPSDPAPTFTPPGDDEEREQVVIEIGTNEQFATASNVHERRNAAKEASATFLAWCRLDHPRFSYDRWLWAVVKDAQAYADEHTVPIIENNLAQRAHRILLAGGKKGETAGRLDIPYNRFIALLAKYQYDPSWENPRRA